MFSGDVIKAIGVGLFTKIENGKDHASYHILWGLGLSIGTVWGHALIISGLYIEGLL